MAFSLRFLVALVLTSTAFAQRCGPLHNNRRCVVNECCSEYDWCGTSPAHCSATCKRAFSGPIAVCPPVSSSTTRPTSTSTPTIPPSTVPEIDVCGASVGIACPGVGTGNWFYRCCSSAGHCGPKNTIQDPGMYCGAGCQAGYGKCDPAVPAPADPAPPRGVSGRGETCGPIVNQECAAGLCCSGSNFCGTGEDFCGAANWCQAEWGVCD